MLEWEPAQIGDFVNIKHGYAFKGVYITDEPTENILVTPGNFCIGGGFKSAKFKYYNGEVPTEYVLKPNDIIVTMTDLSKESDTLGYSAKVPASDFVRYLHNQRIGLVQFYEKEKIVQDFIYWVMRTGDYQGFIVGSSSGSSVMHTSPSRIQEYQFLLPPPDQQKAIASALSSLENKIDLLHRQNKTLEAMAETLFRQLFVEECQEDWEEGTLENVASNIRNSIKVDQINDDSKYIGLEHIDRRDVALKQSGFGSDVSSNKYAFSKNDILFGKLRPYFHKVCFTPFSGICSTDILVIRPKKPEWFAFCLFAFFQNDVVEYANLGSGGTRMPRTDWGALKMYPITIPDAETLKQFNQIVFPSLDKITYNLKQIRTLEKLRDTLLPKLMSGEVRVAA